MNLTDEEAIGDTNTPHDRHVVEMHWRSNVVDQNYVPGILRLYVVCTMEVVHLMRLRGRGSWHE